MYSSVLGLNKRRIQDPVQIWHNVKYGEYIMSRLVILAIFVCTLSVGVFAQKSLVEDENFIGVYAFEATPYWPAFEVVTDSNGLMIKYPNSDGKMDLVISDGALIAKEGDGEFRLSYMASKNYYIISKQYQSGSKRISEKP